MFLTPLQNRMNIKEVKSQSNNHPRHIDYDCSVCSEFMENNLKRSVTEGDISICSERNAFLLYSYTNSNETANERIFVTVAVTFSLWLGKGKAFCERLCGLRRQQPEKDKQNLDYTHSWKNSYRRPCKHSPLSRIASKLEQRLV